MKSKKGMSYTFIFILFFLVLTGIVVYESNNSDNIGILEEAIKNITINFDYTEENDTTGLLMNTAYKVVDMTVYIYKNVAVLAIRFVGEHPEYNYRHLMYCLIFLLILPGIPALIKIIAMLYLFIVEIVYFFRDRIKKK